MKKFIALALVSALSVSMLGGCAHGTQSLANESSKSVESKLVRGKTTKVEVQSMFGEPSQKMARSAGEAWLYSLNETSVKTFIPFLPLVTGDYGSKTRNLEITFNKKNVVTDYEYAEGKQ